MGSVTGDATPSGRRGSELVDPAETVEPADPEATETEEAEEQLLAEADRGDADLAAPPPTAPVGGGVWRGLTPATAAALAVLLCLGGFAAGFLTGQPRYPGDDSPEAGFARDMSTHHGQAVEMGMVAWQRASLPEVRQLGYDIAITQKGQMGIMLNWMDTWGVSPTSTRPAMSWLDHGDEMRLPDGRMAGMASSQQLEALRTAEGARVDVLFCTLMIDHHIAGVHMAKAILERTDREQVRTLAQGMVAAQRSEITALQDLLATLDAT